MPLSKRIEQVLAPIYKQRVPVIVLKGIKILVSLLPPVLTGNLLNNLNQYDGDRAFFYIGMIAAVLAVYFLLDWAQDYLWYRMEYIGTGIIRSYLFANVIRKSFLYHKDHSVGDLEGKVVHDAGIYAHAKISMMPMLFLNIIHILVILALLFSRDVPMTFATIAFSAIFFLLYKLINKHIRKATLREREGYSEVLTTTHETLAGVNTIQLYGEEEFFAHRFEKTVDKYEHFLINLRKWKGFALAANNKLVGLLPLVAVFVGLYLYRADIVIAGIGTIVTYYLLLPALVDPIKSLTEFSIDYQNARAVEGRLEELLADETQTNSKLEQIDKIQSLEFSNICYKYDDGTEVLWDVNFTVKPGDALAVVGPSGAGKTTFLRMLKRQLHPSWGQILINNKNHHLVDEKSYINRIAVLAQDIFVFDDSITANIKFGKDIPDAEIQRLAKICALDHLDLEDSATKLSGGERQRLGLARALACQYDVLILDEPTTELDAATETKIIQNLKAVQQENGCIFIVITHSQNVLDNLCNKSLTLSKPK
ncbi:MAG: ABC transporter ATP-binding protein/permease [Defluviitaleaceae bacterium]|nr:ABC transporter ATP-binding protein/permease [Defluviitaleaceae bacterium]